MLNQFALVGRIKKTPEMIENQDGSKFAIINLAVPRTFKNENGEYDKILLIVHCGQVLQKMFVNIVKKAIWLVLEEECKI